MVKVEVPLPFKEINFSIIPENCVIKACGWHPLPGASNFSGISRIDFISSDIVTPVFVSFEEVSFSVPWPFQSSIHLLQFRRQVHLFDVCRSPYILLVSVRPIPEIQKTTLFREQIVQIVAKAAGQTDLQVDVSSTQVFDLRSTCVSFGHPLALTCDDLRWLWSSSNSYARRRKVFAVWPPKASRHETKFRTLCDLRIRFAPRHKSVRKPVCKHASTCESVWPALTSVQPIWMPNLN